MCIIRTGLRHKALTCLIATLTLVPLASMADVFRSGTSKGYPEHEHAVSTRGEQYQIRQGQFDGYNAEIRRVWIDDMAYDVRPSLQVKGTAKKLGLLSDLEPGEQVEFVTRYNPKQPTKPVLVEIHRQ